MPFSEDTQYQAPISATFTGASQSKDITSPNSGTSVIQLTGTWVGSINVEVSNDGTNYIVVPALTTTTYLFINALTANGIYLVATNGYRFIRLRSTAWTSGTATVNVYGSDAVSLVHARSLLRGATDGTLIGNNGDRLLVDANLQSGQLVPTITNKLRIRYNIADVSLPNTGVYQTIYSRSGTGLFFGVQVGFDNANVSIRLTVDGGQVFDLPLNDIKVFEFNDTTDGRIQMGGFLTSVGNVLDFSSRYSIPYSSNVLIQAASNDGTAHKLKRYMIIQTEDT